MINEIINMTQENELFILHVDDKIFNLTRRTIETYPDTLLVNVINGVCSDDRVIKQGKHLYIDRDPESFKYVVYCLRNYEMDINSITNDNFKRQVIDDLDHFGLYCNYDNVKDNHSVVPMVNIADDKQNVQLDSDNDEMQQFVDQIISNKLTEEEILSKIQQYGPQIGGVINNLSTNKLFQNLNQHLATEDSSTDTIDFSDNDNSDELLQNSPEQTKCQNLMDMDDSSNDDEYEII